MAKGDTSANNDLFGMNNTVNATNLMPKRQT